MNKLDEAKEILKEIGMPKSQQSDLCAYTLLALLQLEENQKWDKSTNEYIRIHDIMEFIKEKYNIVYAENSRETFRKQALHHFRIATIIEDNAKPTNSPNYRYRVTIETLNLIKSYKTKKWEREHEKLPDVILYQEDKKWIYFIEAVTSVGPISPKRILEINEMTKECNLGKIFVTAFIDMKTFKKFAEDLAWETEVWLSEMPDHMIHLNGDKFVGPRV